MTEHELMKQVILFNKSMLKFFIKNNPGYEITPSLLQPTLSIEWQEAIKEVDKEYKDD